MLDEKMIVEAIKKKLMGASTFDVAAIDAYHTALKLIGEGLAEELRQDTSLRAAGAAGTNTALRCASRIRALTSGE